jgi:integrase
MWALLRGHEGGHWKFRAFSRRIAPNCQRLEGMFSELAVLDNPVPREFHLLTLLSGSRPTALQEIKPSHIDLRRRTLNAPKPKGGGKRAFDIPLSRQMILRLVRAIRQFALAGECIPCRVRSGRLCLLTGGAVMSDDRGRTIPLYRRYVEQCGRGQDRGVPRWVLRSLCSEGHIR